jgi:hypothetical protein
LISNFDIEINKKILEIQDLKIELGTNARKFQKSEKKVQRSSKKQLRNIWLSLGLLSAV